MRLAPTLFASGAVLAASLFLACHSSQPESPAAAAPAAANQVQGTVLEVLPAAPYTYLRIKAAQGEVWAAVPAADIKVGAPVTVLVQVRMDKFQSPSLQRTFDAVYMGTLAGAAPAAPVAAAPVAPAAAPAAMPAAMPSAMPSASATAAVHGAPQFPVMEKVAKATGPDAHTIAEIYARKAALNDHTVVVKAKVMKYMEGILGRTWMHLCDGSGGPQTMDFDLTVTTKDGTKVGDVVTVKGTLHLNKDVGSGYVYPVILEDARIVR
jgi:hypothetical protein